MSSLFIISLALTLVAAYFYLNISEEATRLMALIIAAICFILNLIMAFWTIQLLILILILFSNIKDLPTTLTLDN